MFHRFIYICYVIIASSEMLNTADDAVSETRVLEHNNK